MRILHVSYSDSKGGAARAAYRLHCALVASGIDSKMLVMHKRLNDQAVKLAYSPLKLHLRQGLVLLSMLILKLQLSKNNIKHSLNIWPSGLHNKINAMDVDIVHIHWINNETLSIGELANIDKPVVITTHDAWFFCGAEHCFSFGDEDRYRNGYQKNNRKSAEWGIDLNKLIWEYKARSWRGKCFHIIAPSKWMKARVVESKLLNNQSVTVIGNGIDNRNFFSRGELESRHFFGLEKGKRYVLFGAVGGGSNYIKGFDLLLNALHMLEQYCRETNTALIVFGADDFDVRLDVEYLSIGRIVDDVRLSFLYSSADVVVVPSRMESFGQIAAESLACGTPVVGFLGTGVEDIVSHLRTGYLASPSNVGDLAYGIKYCLDILPKNITNLRNECMDSINNNFSYPIVSERHIDAYKAVLSSRESLCDNK